MSIVRAPNDCNKDSILGVVHHVYMILCYTRTLNAVSNYIIQINDLTIDHGTHTPHHIFELASPSY